MEIKELSELFNGSARYDAISGMLSGRARKRILIDGLAGSAAALLFSGLPKRKVPYIIIANDLDEAGYMYHDLCQIAGDKQVLIFPSGYKRDIKYGQIDAPNEILRTEVLNQWSKNKQLRWVVTYPEAIAERVAEREEVDDNTLMLKSGGVADMTETAKRLRQLGFVQVDYVYEPGQYALRGSILDVYSFSNELPYRVDFFGDDIESIRTFNVETQLSEANEESIYIMGNSGSSTSKGVSLLKFVGTEAVLLCHNPQWILSRVKEIGGESISNSALVADDFDAEALHKVVDGEEFDQEFAKFSCVTYHQGEAAAEAGVQRMSLHCTPQGIYHKNFDLIGESFKRFIADGYRILILSDSDKQIDRLKAIFADRADDIVFEPVLRTLHEGFVDNDLKLCVFTDHQIFDRFHKYNLKSDRARGGKLALSLKELNQIEVGDYVVHIDHGIGRFGGLVKTTVNGTPQEMIKLTYLNNDIVFVSIHSLHKLSKYRGKEGEPPRLSKIGSGAWNKVKERTKNKLKDIARDLIKLYAARKAQKGFAFSHDGYLQHELEASFVYEDTPDQLKATNAVKADMESLRPMDRLICGDVGFGKTEVAIRAAFKAAVDGKQTAVLVPTTVLAFQHYTTFKERLKDFPVRIDYLSRARKAKDVTQIVKDLAEGKIDILIGTHKIIGKNIKFKDLGLLVVDEEQKFGVSVKEKLKQMKVNVDTLTMSATPIPRTLQFSLMGARDLSTITTPPANRYPILTSVNSLDDDILSEAINFEMSRNGQVFIVNNHIDGLTNLEQMVHRLVPDARVVVGHGQMKPEKLEQVIIDFANHDYDVLIATTIIESGIDMPNVNTIIINNAQAFGLSELHQLRGRVGRSARKAFCYLLVPPGKTLSATSRRRLQAIESFSDLGSGIHIAMQDLDIRGAGNLLGAEQSGFIADLGYETYQKILKEAMLELSTEEFADTFSDQKRQEADVQGEETTYVSDCVIDSDMELMFPATYVPQEGERISLYQELDNMERETDVMEFRRRLEDRFGRIPREGLELIRIVTLRRIARTLGIEKIILKQGEMYVYFVGEENKAYYQSPAFGRILHYLQENTRRCQLREVRGRRSILIHHVLTVEEAVGILQTVTQLNAV